MKKVLGLFYVLIFSFATISGTAQTNNSTIFRFLEVTPSADAAALGGNHVALFDANSSLFYLNPAYLTPSTSKTVSATFVNQLSDVRIGFANGAYDIKDVGTLGIGIRYAGYGDFEVLDENGVSSGSFRAGDLALSTALSTQLSEKLSVGVAVDFIYSSYHTYNSSAITTSGGVYYNNPEKRFSTGITFRNLGDQLDYYNGVREEIPFDISAGISKKPEYFPFQVSLTFRRLNDWDMKIAGESTDPAFIDNLFRHVILGGEAALSKNFVLRLGYNRLLHEQTKTSDSFDLAGVSIGVGLTIKGLGVDLSRSSYSDLGGIVQISIHSKIK